MANLLFSTDRLAAVCLSCGVLHRSPRLTRRKRSGPVITARALGLPGQQDRRHRSVGLGMTQIQDIARELFRFGRDKIGADRMGEIIAGTPGLSQFA